MTARLTVADCYRQWIDPTAPHQIRIDVRPDGWLTADCNCGHVIADRYNPAEPDAQPDVMSAYREHVDTMIAAAQEDR